MRWHGTWAFTLALAMLLLCASLKASPWVDLQLEAPPECPSRELIEATVARLVPQPPAVPLRVSARFVADGDRWVLHMVFEGGQRVIAGDSCIAVAEALMAMMALAIDPTAALGASVFRDFEHANENGKLEPQDALAPGR